MSEWQRDLYSSLIRSKPYRKIIILKVSYDRYRANVMPEIVEHWNNRNRRLNGCLRQTTRRIPYAKTTLSADIFAGTYH